MPRRRVKLVNGEFYHIFNRATFDLPIFAKKRDANLFLEAMEFYLQPNPPTRFSIYRKNRNSYKLNLEEKLVTIINYCLMPNHFHLTVRQELENGVQKFIQRLTNSYAHYFAFKYDKRGHIFEDKFKAIHIETNEQLIHLSRYIHLNPVTRFIVENPQDYTFSSYRIYLGKESLRFIDPIPVMNDFSSAKKYKEFVESQKDYQKALARIKHLTLE